MTAQPDWGILYINKVKQLISIVEDCRTQKDMFAADPTLAEKFLNHQNSNRPDLVPDDFLAANDALAAIIETYDSQSLSRMVKPPESGGTPVTNKAALFKVC
jgi:hypothetical protein